MSRITTDVIDVLKNEETRLEILKILGIDAEEYISNIYNSVNFISESEFTSPLSEEVYNKIINGKITIVIGESDKTIILPPTLRNDFTPIYRAGYLKSQDGFLKFGSIGIVTQTRTFTEVFSNLSSIQLYANRLNGKTLPNNPSNTGTFVLKCVDGVLTWVEEI